MYFSADGRSFDDAEIERQRRARERVATWLADKRWRERMVKKLAAELDRRMTAYARTLKYERDKNQ